MLTQLLSLWTHMLAAALFAVLALWRLRAARSGRGRLLLVGALAATAVWAGIVAVEGSAPVYGGCAETVRNLAWLAFVHMLMSGDPASGEGRPATGVRLVLAAVLGIVALSAGLDLLPLVAGLDAGATGSTVLLLRITAAAGALVLVHNLYGQAAPAARGGIRLPMLGLAAMWLYDLNLYTVAYLQEGRAPGDWLAELAAMRGVLMSATVPLFALAGPAPGDWRIRLSRAATFQSLSLAAICAYFLVMTISASAGEATGWAWLRGAQVVLIAVMTAAAAVLIPSGRARGWLRVTLAKHFFQHRYDYRAEWLRFTRLMGEAGPAAPPLGERAVKAVADIVEAPAGLLLALNGGRLEVASRWSWTGDWTSGADDAVFAAALAREGRIVDFAALRGGTAAPRDRGVPVPERLLADAALWAAVPLLHDERLVGLVLLSVPAYPRALDWEDFDLLRTAARGAASYLAEAHGQEALSDAARFDEFNRRFAFILHDIKNLVSGLSLVARNAERHADKPEFLADMALTLNSSVGKMNELLAKLAPQESGLVEETRAVDLQPLIARVVAGAAKRHEVRMLGIAGTAVADPARLEQALVHLVDNAIDASAADAPVLVQIGVTVTDVTIAIIDHGTGMSADFVRRVLFQPFASTKPGGFGIGAHQARVLVAAMGGRLEVDSREGAGTRFTITLPLAEHGPLAEQREIAA